MKFWRKKQRSTLEIYYNGSLIIAARVATITKTLDRTVIKIPETPNDILNYEIGPDSKLKADES
jgi:hypothetical protein